MKHYIDLGKPHEWDKQNLVTQKDRLGYFDLYRCGRCGLVGKSYKLGMITIDGRASLKKVNNCSKTFASNGLVSIINCSAFGEEFVNLTPGSIHEIVDPPEGCDNSRGVWVMGSTKPVLLLREEFLLVDS